MGKMRGQGFGCVPRTGAAQVKILHVYKDYHPVRGGIEHHVQVLAEAQAAAGHDVAVLVCALGPATSSGVENGVEVIRAGRLGTAASMPLSPGLPLILARQKPDVVHLHSPFPLGEATSYLFGRSRALVITHHADVVRQKKLVRLYGPLWKKVLARADRIIATSPRYVETSPWLKPVRSKCEVVPLGVDIARFHPGPQPGDPQTLLFVGRHRYYKGLEYLLRALTMVPEARLEVVGEGPLREDWEEEARRLGLGSRVFFRGDVEDADLPDRYRRAGVFVLPCVSRAEAFGTVLLEAMASGLACVTAEVGTGTSFVVKDGETGLVVPPRDPAALAEAILELMQNGDRRRRMGSAGLARVKEKFTVVQMISGVETVYYSALSKKP